MKTKISLIAAIGLFFMINYDAAAQEMKSGIKGGLNVSNLYIDEVNDENARYGLHVGLFTQYPLGDVFAIQPELVYSTKGSRAEYDVLGQEGDVKFNLNYVELPLLAVFKLGESAEIHAGAYLGYLLAANVSTEGDLGDDYQELDRDHFKSFDYGLAGGFALNFNPVTLGLRYNYGLKKLADSNAADAVLGDSKNSVAQIYIALNFAGNQY